MGRLTGTQSQQVPHVRITPHYCCDENTLIKSKSIYLAHMSRSLSIMGWGGVEEAGTMEPLPAHPHTQPHTSFLTQPRTTFPVMTLYQLRQHPPPHSSQASRIQVIPQLRFSSQMSLGCVKFTILKTFQLVCNTCTMLFVHSNGIHGRTSIQILNRALIKSTSLYLPSSRPSPFWEALIPKPALPLLPGNRNPKTLSKKSWAQFAAVFIS